MSKLIARYEQPWSFLHGDIVHSIFSAGAKTGVPVVVLHELPGMTEECLELGLTLSQHFRVHLPLLFGQPGENRPLRICISREIHSFSRKGPGPLLDWLRALCCKLRTDADVPGVGVIGMCLTGGFALALVADNSVLAPVVAQPSIPFLFRASLGLSEAEERAVESGAKRRGSKSVLGLRYAHDWIAPAKRMNAIKDLIGDALDYEPIPGRGHSTLTDQTKPGLDRTIAFLKARLK